MEPNCIFCKIIEKQIPAEIIFENASVLGFKDISPKAPIHYLFIPKKHLASLAETPKEDLSVLCDIYSAIQEVTKKEGVDKSGYKTTIHTGKGGGQIVFHLHVHLLAQK
ncbi:MAG: histidine triad nucleotide-binding protein [Oligoflexia bacterium]|nr:histidine triad nucleotide-binding protein [Oligoflexia bacterium]